MLAAAESTSTPAPRKARKLILAGVVLAAAGCGAFLFYMRQQGGVDQLGGRAAANSLHYVPIATPEPEAMRPDPVVEPVAPIAPEAVVDNAQPSAAAPLEGPATANAPRSTGSSREPAARSGEPLAKGDLVGQGNLLFRQGRLGLAEGLFLKALQADSSNIDAMSAIVRVHLARRDGSEAVRWAKQLIALQPQQATSQLLLGDALALRGDDEAARSAWRRAALGGNATARERLEE